MARSSGTLSTELAKLVPTSDAAAAVQAMADAYGVYMSGATVSGTPIATVVAPKAAMVAAMAFPVPGTAAGAGAVFKAGIVAFWGIMSATPATYWPGATVIAPPAALAALDGTLATTFGTNVGKSLADSAAAMAGDIHTASTGGTATIVSPIAIL